MSIPTAPDPVRLVFTVTIVDGVDLELVSNEIAERFGLLESRTELEATISSRQDEEMGGGLKRCFLLLYGWFDPGELAMVKLWSNELEEHWREEGKRRVNIDPVLVGPGNVVMATADAAFHRVYLRHGIYGELVYVYDGITFVSQPWTDPDYREPETIAYFNGLHELVEARWRN
jgi:hypothetical protein